MEVCSQTHLDPRSDGNKLAVDGFIRFEVPASGRYQIDVTRSSGAFGSDPDFTVFNRGAVVVSGFTIAADDESATAQMAVGPHIMNIYGFYNAVQPEAPEAGDACYNVSINPA